MFSDQIPSTKQQITNNDQITKIQKSETGISRKYDLEERTLAFARHIIIFCRRLPKNTVNYELTSQFVRSACSVGANYREANEALSKKDFIYRIKICRKEAKETSYWINLIQSANPELNNDCALFEREVMELRKIFSSILTNSA